MRKKILNTPLGPSTKDAAPAKKRWWWPFFRVSSGFDTRTSDAFIILIFLILFTLFSFNGKHCDETHSDFDIEDAGIDNFSLDTNRFDPPFEGTNRPKVSPAFDACLNRFYSARTRIVCEDVRHSHNKAKIPLTVLARLLRDPEALLHEANRSACVNLFMPSREAAYS